MSHSHDDIAYWLEIAEALALADYYRGLAALPGNPFGATLAADGEMATCSIGSVDIGLFNRSIGLGVGRPAQDSDVDAAIALFQAANRQAWVLQVSPLARPAALEHRLEARGLRRGRKWAKFWRDTEDAPAAPTDLLVEEVGREQAGEFDRIVVAAFELPTDAPTVSGVVGRPGWHVYLALDGSEAVGAAALFTVGTVGWLGFGATLESHRGRGSQGALFARRIADAAKDGVRLLVTETGEDTPENPNPSYRNMLRAGFRLGYLRQNWLPPLEAAPPS